MSFVFGKRVLLKISGESLKGGKDFGHDFDIIARVAQDIKEVYDAGGEVALVVGGGNIYRGSDISAERKVERVSSDYIGMLATVINALTIQNALEALSINCRVMSAIPISTICEPYIRRKAMNHLEKRRVIIFAAGTGNPFFTTDTAAALRATEMGCDVIMKATKVDGVYNKDPEKYTDAEFLSNVSYDEVMNKELGFMDVSAISLAKNSKTPIVVFSIGKKGNFSSVLKGEGKFTVVN